MALLVVLLFSMGAGLLLHAFLSGSKERALSDADRRLMALAENTGLSTTAAGTRAGKRSSLRASLSRYGGRLEDKHRGRQSFMSDMIDATERTMVHAGRPMGLTGSEALVYLGAWWMALTAAVLLMLIFDFPTLLRVLMGILIVIAYVFPVLAVRGRVQARHEQIDKELRGVINDLILAMSGNAGFDAALSRVIRDGGDSGRDKRIIIAELATAYQSYSFGQMDLTDALRAAGDRMGTNNVVMFIDALATTLATGADPRATLQRQYEQAEALYEESLRNFIKKAQTGLMLRLSPAFLGLIIVIIGPMIMRIAAGFSSG